MPLLAKDLCRCPNTEDGADWIGQGSWFLLKHFGLEGSSLGCGESSGFVLTCLKSVIVLATLGDPAKVQ